MLHDRFEQRRGPISKGGDLLKETLTLEAAMKKALTLTGCRGFCFKGKDTTKPVEVFFKNKDDVQELCGTSWTSYLLVPHCSKENFLHCKDVYVAQKKETLQAIKILKAELENLMKFINIPEEKLQNVTIGKDVEFNMPENEMELAAVKKLLFVNTQVSIAQAVLQNFIAQDASWELREYIYTDDLTEEEMQTRTKYYQKAAKLLSAVAGSFMESAFIDSKYFVPIWKASVDIIKAYPKSCLGAVGVAGLIGALSGEGLVILHMGFRAFLIAVFGESSALYGALVGGAAGIIIGACVVGLIAIHQRRTRSKDEAEANDLRLMRERIAKIAAKELQLNDLVELDNLWTKVFCQPMKLALDVCCPICHEHFRAAGGTYLERAVHTPNCTGNHMVHWSCQQAWQCESGSDTCVICRQ